MDKKYPTDLSDPEWQIIKDAFPRRKKQVANKEISDQRGGECGLLHFQRWGLMANASQWLSPWKSVLGYFRQWKKSGLWPKIHEKSKAGSWRSGRKAERR
ncbi:hypothetical protein CMK14_14270 [Candidatus Poribacteria bacterium]|nr:hypothetical protein [Candidatus Poribacteria bacterium]